MSGDQDSLKVQYDHFKKWLENKLQQKNRVTDVLIQFEQKTGVQRLYLAYGMVALIGLFLIIGYGARILCNLLGFVYPAYASVKAIESVNKDDDTQWLLYWTVYSVFALIEQITDILLFWIPFYWFSKCLFLIWCMLPVSWNGANQIYYKLIRPFVLKYENQIDEKFSQAKQAGGQILDNGARMAGDAAMEREMYRKYE